MRKLADVLRGYSSEDQISNTSAKKEAEVSEYLSDEIIDKLAASLESFEPEKTAGPAFDNLLGKVERTLGTEVPISAHNLPTQQDLINANLSRRELKNINKELDYSIKATEDALLASKKTKRLQALREGTMLSRHPWVLPALLGAGGAMILPDILKPKGVQYEQ